MVFARDGVAHVVGLILPHHILLRAMGVLALRHEIALGLLISHPAIACETLVFLSVKAVQIHEVVVVFDVGDFEVVVLGEGPRHINSLHPPIDARLQQVASPVRIAPALPLVCVLEGVGDDLDAAGDDIVALGTLSFVLAE